jgi:outer membrane protein assembly factor BamB
MRRSIVLLLASVVVLGMVPGMSSASTEASHVQWRFKLDGDYSLHSPGVAADGTIYVAVTGGKLYAINPDGTQKWVFVGGVAPDGPIQVASDGTIYAPGAVLDGGRSVGAIFAIDPDGTQKWVFKAGDFLIAGPGIGPDGNIYAVTDLLGVGLFSLTPAGTLRFSTGRFTEYGALGQQIAFGADQLYFAFDMFGVGPARLFGYDFDGNRVFAVGSPNDPAQAAVGPNGNVVVEDFPIGVGISLSAFTPTGSQAWSFYEFPGNTEEHPAVGPDNVAYTVRNLSTLYALNADGTKKWTYVDPGIMFQPVVAPANDLLFMGGRVTYGRPGFFEAVDTSGHLLWKELLPDEPGFEPYGQLVPMTPPVFSPDGATAYAVTDVAGDGSVGAYSYLYALDLGSSGPSVPNAPSNLQAKGLTRSTIGMRWTDNATDETGFRIERCAGATCTNFVEIATVGANVKTFTDTGLPRRTTYTYRIRAYNDAGNSPYSNTASAATR